MSVGEARIDNKACFGGCWGRGGIGIRGVEVVDVVPGD